MYDIVLLGYGSGPALELSCLQVCLDIAAQNYVRMPYWNAALQLSLSEYNRMYNVRKARKFDRWPMSCSQRLREPAGHRGATRGRQVDQPRGPRHGCKDYLRLLMGYLVRLWWSFWQRPA